MESDDESAAPRDAEEALLAATLDRIDRDGAQVLEQICREHPEHAGRLRQRVLALRELGLIQTWASEQPPQRLGDFRLLRRIGSGGMGVVYHAMQESLGREVALKLIRPETLHVPGARERFARETTIIARLQHPGIVPIYSVGGQDALPYYAMELVRGCTLAEALQELEALPVEKLSGAELARAVRMRSEPLGADQSTSSLYDGTWEQVSLRILRLVAEALEHAHGRGVLHRDLKPSNVMLTLGGRVMLVDFGLSHSEGSDSVTRSGERAGSLPFMPPELLKQGMRGVDRRSDIYSLGVTLYLLLARRLPFTGENEPEIYTGILEGNPPRPRSIHRAISWEAETVCLAAMDRDAARRYATALDFARDLERALERRPIEARRASPWLRTKRWIQTRPALAVAIALAVIAPTAFAVQKVIEVRRMTKLGQQTSEALDLAEKNFGRSLRAVDSMLRSIGADRLDHVPGADPLRIELLEKAGELYGELAHERFDDPKLLALAAASDLSRSKLLERSGDRQAASALVHALLERMDRVPPPGDFELRYCRAQGLLLLSNWAAPDEALAYHAATQYALLELSREQPRQLDVLNLLADSISASTMDRRVQGDRQSAEDLLELSMEMARSCAAGGSIQGRQILARVLAVRGAILVREGRQADALGLLQESLLLRRQIVGDVPRGERERHDVCESANALANVFMRLGRDEESLELLEDAASEMDCLLDDYPELTRFRFLAADIYLNRGAILGKLKREPECVASLQRANEMFVEMIASTPNDAALHQARGTTLLNLCDSQLALGDPQAALETCARCLKEFETAIALEPSDPDLGAWLAPERSTRAKILLAQGRTAEAAEALVEAPRLAGHLRERALNSLKRLLIILKKAHESGDAETIRRCKEATRQALEAAWERGDLDQEPTLEKLAELMDQ